MATTEQTPQIIANRYQIVHPIGQGGMGTVYRVVDRLTGDTMALKHVHLGTQKLAHNSTNASSDPWLNLALEFQTLASLRHPNIISVLDYGFDEQRRPYFTMTLLEEPINICDAARNCSHSERIRLLIQLLQALAYLHRRGITHRDLKPGNVLVTPDQQVKVLDFGLAIDKNQANETAGTLSYMAPEVLQQRGASKLSDLFAVGVIAYEMFAGYHPFDHPDIMELLKNLLQSQPDMSLIPEMSADGRTTLRGIISQLMAADLHQRYQDAYHVINDLSAIIGQPAPQESRAIRESFLQSASFIGREAELSQLGDALTNALRGQGSSWLIAGESGVGKSRLVDELRIRALIQGARVLRGRTVDHGGLPYQLWRDPLRLLAISSLLSDIDAGILKEIIPDIEQLLGYDIPQAPETDPHAAQQRLIRTITFIFRQQKKPVVLILEDLQWANESLLILQQLNQIVMQLPLLILATYRTDESPELSQQLSDMHYLPLKRLNRNHIALLSESILGEAGRQTQVIDLLQRETEGNVFFLVEVVRTLAEDAGRLSDVGRVTLPSKVFAGGIQEIIKNRLNRVSARHQPLLKIAAVAGRQIDMNILRQIEPKANWEAWITACANAAVLTVSDGQWFFAHDKIREGILQELDEAEAAHLHDLVGQAIESAYPAATEERVVVLAYHFDKAHRVDKIARYAVLAGEHHLRRSVYHQAIYYLNMALALAAEDDLSLRAKLCWSLGNAHWGIGLYTEAEDWFKTSLSLYRQAADRRGIAEALLGIGDVTRRRGAFLEARSYFEETLNLCREENDPTGIGQALGRLGVIARNLGDYPLAEQLYTEALAIYEQTGDMARIAGIHSGIGLIAIDQGAYNKARRHYEKSLRLSREIGNRAGTALILTGLGWATYMEGSYAEAQNFTEESLQISREVGDRWMIANNLGNLGKIAVELGDNVAALTYFREALEMALAIDTPPLMLEILPGVVKIYMQTEREFEAVILLALALNHPATYNEVIYQSQPLFDQIKTRMSAEQFDNAVQIGKTIRLTDVINSIVENKY